MLYGKYKRVLAIALCAAMTVGMMGCGNKNTNQNPTSADVVADKGSAAAEGFTYISEVAELEDDSSIYNFCVFGDTLYGIGSEYDEETQKNCQLISKYAVGDGLQKKDDAIALPMNENRHIRKIAVDEEGNIYVLSYEYGVGQNEEFVAEENLEGDLSDLSDENDTDTEFEDLDDTNSYEEPVNGGSGNQKTFLTKIDSVGNFIFEKEITDNIRESSSDVYVSAFMASADGRLCVAVGNVLLLFDQEGEFKQKINVNGQWINGGYTSREGKNYICYYSQNDNSVVIAPLDMERGEVGSEMDNFPECGNGMMDMIDENTFLVAGQTAAYLYDVNKKEATKLFNWLDYDLIREYMENMIVVDENTIMLTQWDWESSVGELVTLKKVSTADVKEKQEITVGCLYEDYELKSAIVKYNKEQSDYHVRMKTYIDYSDWNDNTYTDAVTALNNDLLSANGPDIVALEGINATELAKKGAFADLSQYLEKSEKLDKSDFFEELIQQCTVEGKLITIPNSFTLSTVAGKTKDVGDKQGWTIQDAIKLQDENPGKELLPYVSRDEVLYMVLEYGIEDFIDNETGECHFDSQEFKNLLEMAKRYPSEEEINYDNRGPLALELQRGNVLLNEVNLQNFSDVQYNQAVFGKEPITYIGYPTVKGGSGCFMFVSSAYGIMEKSDNKEAAWAFLEAVLSKDAERDMYSAFSTRKSVFEEQKKRATEIIYVTDPETGEVVKDEEGNPVMENQGGSSCEMGDNGESWTYDYHVNTEEEVAVVEQLMRVAKMFMYTDNEKILNIITEEAAPYFAGQKTIDEVVDIIQSRISLYVMENK